MPTQGYRKGLSDNAEPVPCFVRARIANREHAALQAEAAGRSMTISKLLRALIKAHLANRRAELPQPRSTNAALLREITRLGNNLNQLARQANTGMVPVDADELRRVLAAILAAAIRL